MFVTVTTTITTQIDIETFEPDHKVSIEASDELPTDAIYAAAMGGCRATMNTIRKQANHPDDTGDPA